MAITCETLAKMVNTVESSVPVSAKFENNTEDGKSYDFWSLSFNNDEHIHQDSSCDTLLIVVLETLGPNYMRGR